jgi:hypothetical protein
MSRVFRVFKVHEITGLVLPKSCHPRGKTTVGIGIHGEKRAERPTVKQVLSI